MNTIIIENKDIKNFVAPDAAKFKKYETWDHDINYCWLCGTSWDLFSKDGEKVGEIYFLNEETVAIIDDCDNSEARKRLAVHRRTAEKITRKLAATGAVEIKD